MSPFGVQWGVDTTARALMYAEVIEPVIIVAIGNAGRDRIDEYTPTRDNMHDAGGMADAGTGRCSCTRSSRGLMPPGAPSEGAGYGARGQLAGRSPVAALGADALGGVRQAGAVEPQCVVDDRWIVRQLVQGGGARRPALTIWLDVGTGERRMLKGTRLLYRMLLRKGWRIGRDLSYMEAEGALHDERAWGDRTGLFLRFLFSANAADSLLASA